MSTTPTGLRVINGYRAFALFLLMITATTVPFIAGLSRTPHNTYSFNRGWGEFTSLFGGLGNLIIGVVVTIVLTAILSRIAFADVQEPWERYIIAFVLLVALVLMAFHGRNLVDALSQGNAWLPLGYFVFVSAVTGLAGWIARDIA